MSIKIATPISTLFTDEEIIQKISSLSDALEIRNHLQPVPPAPQYLHHAEESIVLPWTDEEIERIASTINKFKIEVVSFHVTSCFDKPKLVGDAFHPHDLKMSREKMLANANANMKKLRRHANIKNCLIENNNYFNTGAYEIVTEPEFLNTLMADLNIGLLLDIGHAEISAHHMGIPFEQYVNALSLDKVFQIHLSSPSLEKDVMKDAHGELTSHDWDRLKQVVALTKNVRYITIEYYKNPELLISMLKTLRNYIDQTS